MRPDNTSNGTGRKQTFSQSVFWHLHSCSCNIYCDVERFVVVCFDSVLDLGMQLVNECWMQHVDIKCINTRVLCLFQSCPQPPLLSPRNNKPDRNRKKQRIWRSCSYPFVLLLAQRFNNPHICIIFSFKYLYKYIHITVSASVSSTSHCTYLSIYSSAHSPPYIFHYICCSWWVCDYDNGGFLLISGQLIIFKQT